MLAADEPRVAHVDVHGAKLAVPPDGDPLLSHVELEISPLQPCVCTLHLDCLSARLLGPGFVYK